MALINWDDSLKFSLFQTDFANRKIEKGLK